MMSDLTLLRLLLPRIQLNSDALVLQWCQVSFHYKGCEELQNNFLSCDIVKKAQSKTVWADAMVWLVLD